MANINKIEDYFRNYVFPLIGIPYRDIYSIEFSYDEILQDDKKREKPYTLLNNNVSIYNHFNNGKTNVTAFTIPFGLDEESRNLLDTCIGAFCENCLKRNIEIMSEKGESTLFRYCVDSAVCSWVSGQKGRTAKQLEKLLLCLENWSVKTYEGHKVSYAFLFDPNPTSVTKTTADKAKIGSFLDFIDSDYGAVFTDGITSIIEIDSDCNYVAYHSITNNDTIDECKLSKNIPYRFTQVIGKYVFGEKVGIFLLTNGDIILAKNREVFFVKRNNRWLNFRKELFSKIVTEKISNISDALIESVFISALDVSFAHNGGIIAVVDDNCDEWNEDVKKHVINQDNESMVHELDLYDDLKLFTDDKLHDLFERTLKFDLGNNGANDEYEIKRKTRNVRKRITKRKFIYEMISNAIDDSGNLIFDSLDRRFKVEAIGLDGACIINNKGNIISFGAIIKNDAGSSEGGRGAAAKKLSRYGGFAIKISTDGYIEVFMNDDNVYSIK